MCITIWTPLIAKITRLWKFLRLGATFSRPAVPVYFSYFSFLPQNPWKSSGQGVGLVIWTSWVRYPSWTTSLVTLGKSLYFDCIVLEVGITEPIWHEIKTAVIIICKMLNIQSERRKRKRPTKISGFTVFQRRTCCNVFYWPTAYKHWPNAANVMKDLGIFMSRLVSHCLSIGS
jgi:hypothetical protein